MATPLLLHFGPFLRDRRMAAPLFPHFWTFLTEPARNFTAVPAFLAIFDGTGVLYAVFCRFKRLRFLKRIIILSFATWIKEMNA